MVPARDGAVDTGAMAAAIDRRTRVVTTSSVTFTPGFRTELPAIGRACRDAGALFLVDAVQSLGVLDLNVEDAGVDALATSASKGLLGPAGVGFLFVRQAWAERLRPAYVARFSVERGAGHESEMESRGFPPAAERPPVRDRQLQLHRARGRAGLARRAPGHRHPGDRSACRWGSPSALAEGLAALGLPVTVPPAGAARSHIVTVGRLGAGDAYSSHDPRLNRLAAAADRGRGKVLRAARPAAVRIPLLQR